MDERNMVEDKFIAFCMNTSKRSPPTTGPECTLQVGGEGFTKEVL